MLWVTEGGQTNLERMSSMNQAEFEVPDDDEWDNDEDDLTGVDEAR